MAQTDKDSLHQQRILQHLTYDPQSSVDRYPWLIKDKYHQLSNRTSSKTGCRGWTPSSPQPFTTSPTAASDFDQSFLQFKTMGDPFGVPDELQPARVPSRVRRQQSYETKHGWKGRSPARKTMDVLNQISDTKQDTEVSIYSPELETSVLVETPQKTPRRRTGYSTMLESPEEPLMAHTLEHQFEKLGTDCQTSAEAGTDEHTDRLGEVVTPNDPRMTRLLLTIDEYSDATYRKIMEDLRNNVQLRELEVRRRPPTESRQRSTAELDLLYSALEHMTGLKVLHLQHFEADELDALDDRLETSLVLKSLKVQISDLHL